MPLNDPPRHDLWQRDELRGNWGSLGESLRRKSLVEVLADHWLTDIGCDHAAGTDTPVCSCSTVFLGTHPSIGAAVKAWAEHVESAIRAARGGCA